MIVPHHGKEVISVRIPIRTIKYCVIALCVCMVFFTGILLNYRYAAHAANTEKAELEQLRDVNSKQHAQLEQLAKATASLQQDMTRLNQLDADVRKIMGTEEAAGTSRSAPVRPSGITAHTGQGGPAVKPEAKDIAALIQDLTASAKAREQSLTEVKEALMAKQQRLAAMPSIWPATGEVTSRFGWRNSPWGWGSEWHPGLDIANDAGTPILAAADGVVTGSDWNGGYGNMVQIEHANGIVTVYAHNSENLAEVGRTVKKGDIIAYMGNTGASTGPHLHYEVRVNGTAVNPANFL
ncbi:murein DD-endopeptidase MepM [Methylomusa anaerophila]|uniref:Murein DD-endopeptidase MepM n=2 Tax=Methylomusa anaerophila TaxID=1930071 RepID=A0A348AHP3_9FIRM|nr:murein DD-endopeptidase MepM [Methylomusa anaerophila]